MSGQVATGSIGGTAGEGRRAPAARHVCSSGPAGWPGANVRDPALFVTLK